MPLNQSDFTALVRDLREAKAILENCYRVAHDGRELTLARSFNGCVLTLVRDLEILDKRIHGQNGKH